MSTEENVKKLLEYCYSNIRGGFNEPPYTASPSRHSGLDPESHTSEKHTNINQL